MTFVGSIGSAANATNYPMTVPEVQDNDVLYLFVARSSTTAVSTIKLNGADAGCTLRYSIVEAGLTVDIYTRTMADTDDGKTLTVGMAGTSKTAVAGSIHRGVDTSDPMPAATTIIEHDNTTTRTSPAVTVTESTDIISFIAERTASGTTISFAPPPGVTKAQDQVNTGSAPDNATLGYVAGVGAGTFGPYSWTVNGGAVTARRVGVTVGLNAAGGVPPASSARFRDASGAAVPVASTKHVNAAGTSVSVQSWSVA